MINITLRRKPLKGNKESLFLDYYPSVAINGKETRREFLGIHIFAAPKTKEEKDFNKKAIEGAEKTRVERLHFYNIEKGKDIGSRGKNEGDFFQFANEIIKSKTPQTQKKYTSVFNNIKSFTNGNLLLNDINNSFLNGFIGYLETKELRKNYISDNLLLLKVIIKQAVENELLPPEILKKYPSGKREKGNRTFLTLEELKKLFNTPIPKRHEIIKRACLFSALTGLRYSDIVKLTSENVIKTDSGSSIQLVTKKNNKPLIVPISTEALALVPENTSGVLFPMPKPTTVCITILKWAMVAGINKHLTFHCFRHTYATLQLAAGTDITTIKEILGHSDISTTLIYAKIVDKKKEAAANAIKLGE